MTDYILAFNSVLDSILLVHALKLFFTGLEVYSILNYSADEHVFFSFSINSLPNNARLVKPWAKS